MSQPFVGEIRIFAFNFAPRGWAQCNGQLLAIAQNQALFALLGTMYGGNGSTTFGLPELRGRVPLHRGTNFTQGQVGGTETVTLLQTQIPGHTHQATANAAANSNTANQPTNNFWSNSGQPVYAATPTVTMAAGAIGQAGGNQPHENRSPYLTTNICIALQGIFPSRN